MDAILEANLGLPKVTNKEAIHVENQEEIFKKIKDTTTEAILEAKGDAIMESNLDAKSDSILEAKLDATKVRIMQSLKHQKV